MFNSKKHQNQTEPFVLNLSFLKFYQYFDSLRSVFSVTVSVIYRGKRISRKNHIFYHKIEIIAI